MAIWGIADLHASGIDPDTGLPSKPMDIFGPQWADHMERIEGAWTGSVKDGDTVIVAGDIDWALDLPHAMETLKLVDSWPGKKVLVRGNHDYWWSSKTTGKVRRAAPPTVHVLHNDACQAEGFNICGSKGSPVPGGIDWTPENEKILRREEQRLRVSLEAREPELPTIAALHYPPFYPSTGGSPYRTILEEYEVVCALYGHLHGAAAAAGPRGLQNGIQYVCVAADAIDFRPVLLARDGVLALSG